jgi:hypothetical protein
MYTTAWTWFIRNINNGKCIISGACVGHLKGRKHFERLGVDKRIILKQILKK